MITKEHISNMAHIVDELDKNDSFRYKNTEKDNILVEMGINVNYETHEVEFTDAHENGVDTSLEHNPVVDTATIPGITVYSIFQRNDAIQQDGNPLIYALKGSNEHGWNISDENRTKLTERIQAIVGMFCEKHPVDFTIVVPSGGGVNSMLRDILSEVLSGQDKENIILNNTLEKMTVDEVEEEMFEKDSPFSQEFDTPEKKQRAWEKIKDSFARMRSENNGVFSYKMVRPPRYREWITKTLKFSDRTDIAEMASKLPGKNILIIDDTITFGNTIRSAANLIRDTISNIKYDIDTVGQFAPASISALTLLSVKQHVPRR